MKNQTGRKFAALSIVTALVAGIVLTGCSSDTSQPGAAPDPTSKPTHEKPTTKAGGGDGTSAAKNIDK